jgi:hypothetical protein
MVTEEIKESCFRRYLSGAINTHALAYMSWRESTHQSGELEQSRLKRKRVMQQRLEKLIRLMELTMPESDEDSEIRASSKCRHHLGLAH